MLRVIFLAYRTCVEEVSCAYGIFVQLKRCDNLGEVDVGGDMYLNGSLRDCAMKICTGFKCLRIGFSVDLL